jgi:diguanylate cyclase (GGDEF)-like protein/PAS domain S-box-containing protein
MNRTNQALIAVWVVIAACIALLIADLVNSRRLVETRLRDQAVSYVRLIEQHASAAFDRGNSALLGVIDHLRPDDMIAGTRLPENRRKEIDALLLSQQRRTEGISSMYVADADGNLIAHALGDLPAVNVGDRTHFQTLKRERGTAVAVSEAMLGRVTNTWGVNIGRRVDFPDGSFAGMAGAGLGLAGNFTDFYASLPLGKDSAITLRDPENRLLVRYPSVEGQLGQTVATSGWIRERLLAGDAEGVITIASNIDGIERVFAFRRLSNYPIYAAIGLSLDVALSGWRAERNALVAGALLLLLAGVFITVVLRRNQLAEQGLAESETRFRALAEQSLVGILLYGAEGLQYVNPGCARVFGYAQGESDRLTLLDLVAEKDKARVAQEMRDRLSGVVPQGHYTFQGLCKDRSTVEIEIYSSRMQIAGKPVAVAIMVDITERRRAEEALARESFRNRMLLRNASDGICILDENGNALDFSDAFCNMLGYAREALLGMNVSQWDVRWSAPEGREEFRRLLASSRHTTTFESTYRRKDESVFDVETYCIGLEFEAEPMLFMSSRDISERKRAQEQILHRAHYDALTGIPNRSLFYDRLTQGIVLAKRDRYELALLYLDLDRFKTVNDELGHEAGDEVLRISAARIRGLLRESDTVARLGGDEFSVILPRINSREDAAEVAAKIVDAMAAPFQLRDSNGNTREVCIGCSAGIAIFPMDAESPDRLVVVADAAMYEAKRSGLGFRFRASSGSR